MTHRSYLGPSTLEVKFTLLVALNHDHLVFWEVVGMELEAGWFGEGTKCLVIY